ncbi:hypothetical protein GMD78_06240 [Ornithinibacillus sp. L9]|uniref:Uncharacterized protein n=1 Tax=Ornithinibacillus caprae TaxID=2678566 RepID=A0A6N8FJ48_9BACI|nr:hypothetical protein [Ornithinibacillus caprae]MUK87997.1 hypothetical protein [Ornithinibacillus caprae]
MAKSKAQKKRQKLIREGRLNPEINRSPYVELDLRTRKTKNKKDMMYRTKHKKNRYPHSWENDSFLIPRLDHKFMKIPITTTPISTTRNQKNTFL